MHTSADPALLAATLRATWPDGVCTDTGIYYQPKVEMPLLPMYTRGVQFVTGRVNARAVIPQVLELLADGLDLSPAVDRVVAVGGRSVGLADDDRQDRLHQGLGHRVECASALSVRRANRRIRPERTLGRTHSSADSSGDIADEHRHAAQLHARQPRQPFSRRSRPAGSGDW